MNFIISVFIHFLVNKSFQAKMFQRNRSSLWLLPGSTLTCVIIMTIVMAITDNDDHGVWMMITNDEDEDKMVNLLPLPGSAAGTNCSHPGKNQLQRKQFHIFLTILIMVGDDYDSGGDLYLPGARTFQYSPALVVTTFLFGGNQDNDGDDCDDPWWMMMVISSSRG